ncbi:hypothetical protein FPV67DRAFT_778275 [Lyophyllum atratum]|nr:hypothetical protein FPV67DRAFT_778275 [Lyophyllum atratum]
MPRFIIVDEGTIRDLTDEDEVLRARKRKRVGDDKEIERPSLRPNIDGTEILIHDPYFYHADDPQADCYIRVENMLYKIHGQVLLMSKLLTARLSDRSQPTSSREPLELFGLSVNEFRALLWARYASEEDAKDQPKAQEDLVRLLHLATVTHNFGFTALHKWSIQSMHYGFASNAVLAETCSSANFTRAIEIAAQYKANELLEAAVSKWSDRVRRREIPAVPAMLAADAHKLSELRGVAYYAHLLDAIEHSPPPTPTSPFRIQADPKLSDKQLVRLLSGHVSLVNFSEQYRRRPPKLECAEGCSTEAHRACTLVWNERWLAAAASRKVFAHTSADILAILATMCEQLTGDEELAKGLNEVCRLVGLQSLKLHLCDARESLPQYFLGCYKVINSNPGPPSLFTPIPKDDTLD